MAASETTASASRRGRGEPRRPGRMGRVLTSLAALALTAALAAACMIAGPWATIGSGTPQSEGAGNGRTDVSLLRTQEVASGSLTAETRLNGQLAYDAPSDFAAANGMITQLPVAGAEIKPGERVYEADGVPVPLFQGSRPFWRSLAAGASDGPDVRQLEENLKLLGHFSGTPDERFDQRTAAAVKAWQRKALGLADAADGVFQPGSVAVAPSTPVRITAIKARAGDVDAVPASYTGVALHASATVTASQAAAIRPGDRATLTLPDNTALDATIAAVDQGGGKTEDGQTVRPSVRVDFADQTQVAGYGTAAVKIVIPGETTGATDALIVPVTAIVADPGGGYAIEVVRGQHVERVAVEIGIVAVSRVQLTKADGVKAGDRVVVA